MTDQQKLFLRDYLHRSVTDSYRWAKVFSMKFGPHSLDLKTKMRTARKSASICKRIIESGEVTGDIQKEI